MMHIFISILPSKESICPIYIPYLAFLQLLEVDLERGSAGPVKKSLRREACKVVPLFPKTPNLSYPHRSCHLLCAEKEGPEMSEKK